MGDSFEAKVETVMGDGEINNVKMLFRGDSCDFGVELANFDGEPPKYNVFGLGGNEECVETFTDRIRLPIVSSGSAHVTFEGEHDWSPEIHAEWLREIAWVVDYEEYEAEFELLEI